MPLALPDPNLPWPIPLRAVYLTASKESLRLKAYLCPAGVWTCGYGETHGVRPTDVWTKQYADGRFLESIKEFSSAVVGMCTLHPNENELGALTSLAYNIGIEALRKSSVMRCHNANDKAGAARAFGLYNKARVKGVLTELGGLTSRRAAESALYLEPTPEEPTQPMPQAVAGESSLASSPITQSGMVTAAAGGLTVAAQVSDQAQGVIGTLSNIATTLHVQPLMLLGTVLVAAGAAAMYWRFKQRAAGWT